MLRIFLFNIAFVCVFIFRFFCCVSFCFLFNGIILFKYFFCNSFFIYPLSLFCLCLVSYIFITFHNATPYAVSSLYILRLQEPWALPLSIGKIESGRAHIPCHSKYMFPVVIGVTPPKPQKHSKKFAVQSIFYVNPLKLFSSTHNMSKKRTEYG